jgi:hypothetical protein
LQQLGALVEQIDRDQPFGELADLRRDHVPAEAAQENLDPGRKSSVGRGAVCARGQSRADRHGPAPVDFTPSSPGRTKRRDPAIPFQGAKPCPMNRDGRDKPGHDVVGLETWLGKADSIVPVNPLTTLMPLLRLD